jgi:hypothetical protein
VFPAVRKPEEKGLQAREANGRNDEHTNASESGFVYRSCSYANVGFFWVRSPMRTTRTGRQI